jgi:hypothetical protein
MRFWLRMLPHMLRYMVMLRMLPHMLRYMFYVAHVASHVALYVFRLPHMLRYMF